MNDQAPASLAPEVTPTPPSPGGAVSDAAAGIVLGAAASVVIGRCVGWQTQLRGESIFLAVGFSAAVGIFFGFYPARKASHLLPIKALRYE